MRKLTRVARPIVYPIISAFLLMTMPINAVHAAMVQTESLIAGEAPAFGARERVETFFQRQDVQQVLQSQGIDPTEARSRIDGLTDAEVQRIANEIDQLPAGGSTVGTILGVAVLVFVILLITDILGFTDVFPFVKK